MADEAPLDRYTVGPQRPVNRWDDQLQQAVAGVEILIIDQVSGNTVPVFVPRSVLTVENARTLIERELRKVRAIHNLGG